ncbi:Methanogenic corrinoid protein MtbC1 [Actinomadura meyerae]|jgi:methanogenic corrinoid protein MtbC1|uniref:Methanogenic corrinoid protein MtbC1 n=1 Tax=Actinomadura meyerae TaxID=240840 RepID=A0A239KY56_9ACTN|nr:cobalamin-dependent protein [Actinomadura meyerae]SNT22950.1 Methanogenic corrinoid protein MtbC1 [Actinomadura meyerae]
MTRSTRPSGGKAEADVRTDELWAAVMAGDEYAATDIVMAALDGGMDPEALLMDVIAPLQARVGQEWAANRITVAQEHTATAVTERVIGAVAHHPAVRRRGSATEGEPGRVAVACIDGEWHALPARLLAEVLRLRGWRVDYLGAQVPTPHLIAHLHRTRPAAVALSSSIPTRLPDAHAAITACQATGTPVMVGGAAYGPGGRYAARLGADAWEPDARAAADRLARGLPEPRPHRPADDLPHLADQTYTHVTRTAPRLVRHVLEGLRARVPAMADYTVEQRDRTAEDVSHIVDFFATALYLDEPDLFTGFMAWTIDILAARDVPPQVLLPVFDLLAEQLADYPRATELLSRGRTAVQEHKPATPAANPEATHNGHPTDPAGE